MAVLSADEIFRVAMQAGFTPDQAVTMTAIALAESGGNTQAHNPNGEDSRGLWQINLRAHRGWAGGMNLWDPVVNAQAAYRVSGGGANISPWTVTHTTKGTRYAQFRAQAQEAASRAGYQVAGNFAGSPGYGNTVPAGVGGQMSANFDWGALEGVEDWSAVSDYATFNKTVRERFPSWSWAMDHDELGPLLRRAADEEWSPELFQSQLEATAWFRNRSEQQRQWDILTQTDQGSAQAAMEDARAVVERTASSLGARISEEDREAIALAINRDGIDQAEIIGRIIAGSQSFAGGEWTAARQSVNELAGAYFLDLEGMFGEGSVDRYTRQILTGEKTMEGIEEDMRVHARNLFPHLSEFIDQGINLAEYFAPHKQRVEAMLGRPVNMLDDRWRPILGFSPDGASVPRPMAVHEVEQFIRTQDEYWSTAAGQEQKANMVLNFRRAMGVAA